MLNIVKKHSGNLKNLIINTTNGTKIVINITPDTDEETIQQFQTFHCKNTSKQPQYFLGQAGLHVQPGWRRP